MHDSRQPAERAQIEGGELAIEQALVRRAHRRQKSGEHINGSGLGAAEDDPVSGLAGWVDDAEPADQRVFTSRVSSVRQPDESDQSMMKDCSPLMLRYRPSHAGLHTRTGERGQ